MQEPPRVNPCLKHFVAKRWRQDLTEPNMPLSDLSKQVKSRPLAEGTSSSSCASPSCALEDFAFRRIALPMQRSSDQKPRARASFLDEATPISWICSGCCSTLVCEQLVPARKNCFPRPGVPRRSHLLCNPLALMNPAARQGLRLLHGHTWNSAPQLNNLLVRQLASLAVSSPSVTPSTDLPGLWQDQSWSTWVQDLQESCSALWQHTTQSLWLAVPKRKVCAWKAT